jgi:hypothetical protein
MSVALAERGPETQLVPRAFMPWPSTLAGSWLVSS